MKIILLVCSMAATILANSDVTEAPANYFKEGGFYKFASPDETSEFGEGFITKSYFEGNIVAGNESTVMNNQTWFLYLYHSKCNIPACRNLNENYQRLYHEYINI